MFQNTSQLIAAMKEILTVFQQGNDIASIYPKYSDGRSLDLVEAINACLDKGYLTGVSCSVGIQGDVIVNIPAPHVTASGAEFIAGN